MFITLFFTNVQSAGTDSLFEISTHNTDRSAQQLQRNENTETATSLARSVDNVSGLIKTLESTQVAINHRAIRAVANAVNRSGPATIEIPIPGSKRLVAVIQQSTLTPGGGVLLTGSIRGDTTSHLDMLVSVDNVLMGTVGYTDKRGLFHNYRIRHNIAGAPVFERFVTLDADSPYDDVMELRDIQVADVNRSRLEAAKQRPLFESTNRRSTSLVDDGSLIDVMILYTAKARVFLGGQVPTKAAIEFSVEKANRGWMKSGVKHRIRLVHTALLRGYRDDGLIDLQGLSGNGDGVVDYVHALRNHKGADLVMIIGVSAERIPTQRICGVGYLPHATDLNGDIVGFSYVQANCVVGALSVAHEFGHNFGALHDRAGYDGGNQNQYNYGYATGSNKFRTVMAYSRACGDSYCPRINLWSNPRLRFRGERMGESPPASTSANNVRQLNNLATRVSRYRKSQRKSRPRIVLPRPDTWLAGDNALINFADNGTAVTAWRVNVGSTSGASDYYSGTLLGRGQRRARLTGLPTDGRRVYVTLEYLTGTRWRKSIHRYKSYSTAAATILDQIKPLRDVLSATPEYAYLDSSKKRFLIQRIKLLGRAVEANDTDSVNRFKSHFYIRTNGCKSQPLAQPDTNDYLINCNSQQEVDVYFRSILVAARQL